MSSREPKTSETHPIRADFLPAEVLNLPGRLGMTLAPGVHDTSGGSRWKRDLDADLWRLKEHYRTDVLVSLLELSEYDQYKISNLVKQAEDIGLEAVHFPIVDVDVPAKSEQHAFADLIDRVAGDLREGKTVVVHCRGGLGRTGTVAASVLVALGRPAGEAIRLVREARSHRAVETSEQEEYVRRFEKEARKRGTRGPHGRPAREAEATQIERYRGCLLGLAVGDALGTTLEFKPPGTFSPLKDMVGGGEFGLEPGQWTDDTSMALCLAESLIEKRSFDPADQLEKYVRWYREGHMSSTGRCFDIGNTTRKALKRFEKTRDPFSGLADPNSAGNGSIMRLAPVPLFYAKVANSTFGTAASAVERSAESSRTTHGARAASDACRYLAALIVGAVNGAGKEELLSERYGPMSEYWEEHPLAPGIDEIAAGSFKRREPPEIQGTGYVVRSLEAALWAFYHSDSFREGALLAVNLGDDADTTGAVYGQLAGAFYGERGIPQSWRSKLAHRLLIEHFTERIFDLGPTVDWERVLDFLPLFEQPGFVFGSEKSSPGYGFVSEDGSSTKVPYYEMSPESQDFMETLYAAGVIQLVEYGDVERLARYPAALASADEYTLQKLLTFHARKDRYAEGHFGEMLESGHITAILRRLEELHTSSG